MSDVILGPYRNEWITETILKPYQQGQLSQEQARNLIGLYGTDMEMGRLRAMYERLTIWDKKRLTSFEIEILSWMEYDPRVVASEPDRAESAADWRRRVREVRKMLAGATRISTRDGSFEKNTIQIIIEIPKDFIVRMDEYTLSVYEYALDPLRWYRLGKDAVNLLLREGLINQVWADEILQAYAVDSPKKND